MEPINFGHKDDASAIFTFVTYETSANQRTSNMWQTKRLSYGYGYGLAP